MPLITDSQEVLDLVKKGKSGKRTIKKHLFNLFKQKILQCDKSRNGFISPNSRAIFLDFNPLNFQEFYGILKSGSKLKI